MMDALRRLRAEGELDDFDGFQDPEAFDRLMARLAKTSWIVYAKRPFRQADHVLKYLGRYTHRVGIANSRLVDVTVDAVTFRTKNGKTVTLEPVEFLRRFVQHVLPKRFQKIRHYGLYAAACVDTALDQARSMLDDTSDESAAAASTPLASSSWEEQLLELTGRDVLRCPHCGGLLERRDALATARAPPEGAAA